MGWGQVSSGGQALIKTFAQQGFLSSVLNSYYQQHGIKIKAIYQRLGHAGRLNLLLVT
jgi:hypothetical protein